MESPCGLICAFWLDPVERCPDGAVEGGIEGGIDRTTSETPTGKPRRPIWLHFNLADVRARRWLQEMSGLAPEVVNALVEPQPRIHVETAETREPRDSRESRESRESPDESAGDSSWRRGIVPGQGTIAVLGDLHHDFDLDPEGFGLVRFFVDRDRVISVRRERLRTVDRIRRDLMEGLQINSTAALFEHFARRLTDTFTEVVTKLADEVDETEDQVLAGRFRAQGAVLGRVRMSIARLRRHIARNRIALSGLRGPLTHQSDGDRRPGMRLAIEQMETAAQDIDLVQERTRLLQEEIAGRLGESTNRDLFMLSTITAALLPINVVTGIFGMNVGGLPGLNSIHGFTWVMLGMVSAVGLVLLLLRWRRKL